MSRTRDWCKLDEDWTGNKKAAKLLRRFGPVAGAYMTTLIARAYRASHHRDNPHGAIACTRQDIADSLHDRHDRAGLWQAMIDVQLIIVRGDGWQHDAEADIVVELCDFAGWQHPKGSHSRRKMEQRDRARNSGNSREVSQLVPVVSQLVPQTETETETEKKNATQTSTTARARVLDAPHPTPEQGGDEPEASTTTIQHRIRRCRRDLGDLALDVDSVLAAIHHHHGTPLSDDAAYYRVWRPLPGLVAEFGRSAVRDALASLVKRPDVRHPDRWLARVAREQAARPASAVGGASGGGDEFAAMRAALAKNRAGMDAPR